MKNSYDILKQHFDKLMYGPVIRTFKTELIRQSLDIGFGSKTVCCELLETNFVIPTNYITGIATFIGDDPDDEPPVPIGIVPVADGIKYVNYINSEDMNLNDDNRGKHLLWVMESMRDIISEDIAFSSSHFIRCNYHACVLQALPLYMGFHHAAGPKNRNWLEGVLESEVSILRDYINRWIAIYLLPLLLKKE